MINFAVWLVDILAKEVVKGGGHSIVDRLHGSKLDQEASQELKAWENYVKQHYAPGIQPNVLRHIFRLPQPSDADSSSYQALHSYLRLPDVPPTDVWLDVLIASWKGVKKTPGPLQPFFEDDLRAIKPYLEDLAGRLFQVCKQNETLFKGAMHRRLESLEHKHDISNAKLDEILRVVKKELNFSPPEKGVIFDSSPPMNQSSPARPLIAGMEVIAAFHSKPSQRWRDPKPDLIGIWTPASNEMTPILAPVGGWGPPPICVPNYWVDVEWRLPSHIDAGLWGPVKERVVQAFVASLDNKFSLCRIVSLRAGEPVVVNCAAYGRHLWTQTAYYKGLENALANHRFWKNQRIRRLSKSALKREAAALVKGGELIDLVPQHFRNHWDGRPIEAEDAFLILNGLRKRENAASGRLERRHRP
jgi:hypothetical protein